ncbi:hypothetical protein V8E54_001584 [Elaphomyces granulatus]
MSTSSESSTDSTVNAGPGLVIGLWVQAAIATIIVSLRVVAKLQLHKFERDDVITIFALLQHQLSTVVGSAMVTTSVHYGFGRSVTSINPKDLPLAVKFDYFSHGFGLAGCLLSRIAFILYLITLLGTKKIHRTILWSLLIFQLITNSLCILFIYIQCPGNPSAIWDQSIKAYCWSPVVQADYGYFIGSINTATDLYLAAFPTYVFWNMKLRLRLRISLMILLGLGLFAMVASIIKTVQIYVLSTTTDPTVHTVVLVRWLYIEAYLVIITSSIPCIRSLVMSVKNIATTRSNSYPLRSPYNSRSGTDSVKKETKLWRIRPSENDTASEEGILEDENGSQTRSQTRIVKKVDISVTSTVA